MKVFAAFMEETLYGPQGYYTQTSRPHRPDGDFVTAPEVGSLFGELLAARLLEGFSPNVSALRDWVEIGASEGALARGVAKGFLQWAPQAGAGLSYWAVERCAARRQALEAYGALFRGSFHVCADLRIFQERPTQGLWVANEFIDALPVHRVRCHHGGLEEAYVDVLPGNRLRWHWGAPSTPALPETLDRLGLRLPEGYVTEIRLAARSWLKEASRGILQGGMVVIDYGYPTRELYAPERNGGTLRTFRCQQVGEDLLESPGTQDLTADVDFTALALDAKDAGFQVLGFLSLSAFLLPAAQKVYSRCALNRHEAAKLQWLLHPEGLGESFQVLVLGKNWGSDFSIPFNRLARLGLDKFSKETSCAEDR